VASKNRRREGFELLLVLQCLIYVNEHSGCSEKTVGGTKEYDGLAVGWITSSR